VDVTAFIRELLFGHDCVIVPGFGGFIGNYTPARIDKSTGTFYPPVKQISFNRNLEHNDGLLIGRISKQSGVNYGDARTLVEEFVAGLRKKLEKGEKIRFDNIGSFTTNHEGNIQFEPDRNVNYLLDSYGLEPFQCLPLEGYDTQKSVIKRYNKNPLSRVTLRKVLWRAAVIIPLLSLLVIAKTDLMKKKVEAGNMNPLVTAEFESNKSAVDQNNDIDLSQIEKASEPVSTEITPAVISEPVPSEAKPYFVITGSFKSRENAEIQVIQLQEEGFTPEVVTADNGFYRVCALTCNDMNAAVSGKDSISDKFPGSWISRKK
jgi:hypothetical protein